MRPSLFGDMERWDGPRDLQRWNAKPWTVFGSRVSGNAALFWCEVSCPSLSKMCYPDSGFHALSRLYPDLLFACVATLLQQLFCDCWLPLRLPLL